MPVLDTSLAQRRANIGRSISALCSKQKRALTVPELDTLNKWEMELRSIEEQIGNTFDEAHQKAFVGYLRNPERLSVSQRHDMDEADYRTTQLHYRAGQLISSRTEYRKDTEYYKESRATVGLEGTPSGGSFLGSGAGTFVPLSFTKKIMSAAKYTAPWLDIADVWITASGSPLIATADNDIDQAAVAIDETGTDSTQDVALVAAALGSFRWTSKIVKVSDQMLTDAGVDIEEFLASRFAARMMRGLSPIFTNGVGTTEPRGALTGLTASVTAQGAADTDATSAANTIGLRDLVALEQALDPAYRSNAKWMMHPNTLAALRNVKDANKRPVFGSLNRPEGPILLGYAVVLNPSMDQLQATPSSPTVTRTTVAFGDWTYFQNPPGSTADAPLKRTLRFELSDGLHFELAHG